MYRVYCNRAAASYLSLFFFSNFQKLKIFITLSSGTVRPKIFKLSTLDENGWVYRLYQIRVVALYIYCSLNIKETMVDRTYKLLFT